MDLKNICYNVCELAVNTGKWIKNERNKFTIEQVESKSKNNFVTYVDKASEQKLVDGLRKILPEAGYITEEGSAADIGHIKWVIDPLDGTTNFIHGLPPFSISIGLIDKDNKSILGVVYEIYTEECFYAWFNGGAYLNNTPIKVSKVTNVEDSLVATGFPYSAFDRLPTFLDSLRFFFSHTHGVRRLGSAAVDLAYVACGRFEMFYEYNLNPWDIAAGMILVNEAGGKVTDFDGGNNCLFGKEIVASNGFTHDKFLEIVKHYK